MRPLDQARIIAAADESRRRLIEDLRLEAAPSLETLLGEVRLPFRHNLSRTECREAFGPDPAMRRDHGPHAPPRQSPIDRKEDR